MVGLFLAVATKVWMSESKTEDTAGGVNALTHLHNLLQRAEQSTVLDAKQESELEAAIQAHDNCTDTMTIGEQGDLDTLITAARLKYCKHGRTQETAANTEGKRKRVTLNRFSPDTVKETNKRKKKSARSTRSTEKLGQRGFRNVPLEHRRNGLVQCYYTRNNAGGGNFQSQVRQTPY